MDEKPARTRNFFKVIVPGFHEKLNLAPAFCKNLEEKSKHATLSSRKGTWKITVFTNCEGLICLRDGWPRFVHDHALSIGDFLLFQHAGKLNFNVSVFDSTACEKEFLDDEHQPPQSTQGIVAKNTEREPETESFPVSYQSENPYFAWTMNHRHASKLRVDLCIPRGFVRINNLEEKTSVSLKDPQGRAWPVNIYNHLSGRFGVRMGKGWNDFYESNELKDGDVCVFELNSCSLTSTSTVFLDVRIFPFPAS